MGESLYLGQIVSTGAGSQSNLTTAAPFVIPPGSKVTLYSSAAVNVLTDNRTAGASGANKGVPVGASSNFPTSVGRAQGPVNGVPSAAIAVYFTGAAQTVDVWQRSGTE